MYGFGLAFINGLFKGRLGMVGIYKCGIMGFWVGKDKCKTYDMPVDWQL